MATSSIPLAAIRTPPLLIDADGRIVAANDRATALSGRSPVGLLPEKVVDLFHHRYPDGRQIASGAPPSSRTLRGWRGGVDIPLEVMVAGGRTISILATASPIREGDQVTGAPVTRHNITARRRAEESQARLGAPMDNNPSPAFLKDEQDRYVYVIRPASGSSSTTRTGWGKTDFDFWPKESARRFRANDRDVLAVGQTRQSFEDSTDRPRTKYCWLTYKVPFTGTRDDRCAARSGRTSSAPAPGYRRDLDRAEQYRPDPRRRWRHHRIRCHGPRHQRAQEGRGGARRERGAAPGARGASSSGTTGTAAGSPISTCLRSPSSGTRPTN